MDYNQRFRKWLESEYIDDETRNELLSIKDSPEEIKDRFYTQLQFGTAGLRGKIGAGDNRMNRYNIARVTQGLANYIASRGESARKRGVVIAYDVRHHSREFAETAASVLCANGIKVFLFDDIRPTPELSFSVIHLSTISGIMVTASHNPKEYNGYKLYWEDGAQVLPEIADGVYREIEKVDLFSDIRYVSLEQAKTEGFLVYTGKEIDDLYINRVKSLSLRDSPEELDKDIRIVFTPLNGTGNGPIRRVLEERGFKKVFVVPEQEEPDPDFTTVGYPNPEDVKAFKLAVEMGEKVRADVLLAADPDADRMAVMVRQASGYVSLNGNQTGALLVNYILLSMREKGILPGNGFIVKSIVTGDLAKTIAENYGVKTYETLTGFKNICGKALEIKESRKGSFIFGYEESIGYVTGTFVRDKDAVSSSMLFCEMAAYFLKRGLSLYEVLEGLFEKYGFFAEKQISLVLEGVHGQERIARMMKEYRKDYPVSLDGVDLVSYIDYFEGIETFLRGEEKRSIDIPRSDVVKYFFSDGSWYAVRPSGTEPKLKLYIYSRGKTREATERRIEVFEREIMGRLNRIK
jgi:phosphoglucomutase